jgi:DNA polymerase-3 subunit delta'
MAKAQDVHEIEALPRPEETTALVGHEAAEAELLAALRGGRPHHAWLISGARGIGKATLAFRCARFLLRYDREPAALAAARTFGVPETDPIARQIACGVAQDLLVLRCDRDEKTGAEKKDISAETARGLPEFFRLTPGAGGWRVAIIDAVDELNRHSANALLKILEEPPTRALILLVSHAPGRALATIRSRCRKLALKPLSDDLVRAELARVSHVRGLDPLTVDDETQLLALAAGSLGRALDLRVAGGMAQYHALERAMQSWPDVALAPIVALLETGPGRQRAEAYQNLSRLLVQLIRGVARDAAAPQNAAQSQTFTNIARQAPSWAWADLASDLEALFARWTALNLDERAVISEAVRRIAAAGRAGAMA